MTTRLPYPGLRAFQPEEADIFFGREEQTDELLRKLGAGRFLAVTGPSGCGKSSLVLAGMIPSLETGFMVNAGPRWRIATMRPGSRPISNFAHALAASVLSPERAAEPSAVEFLIASLQRGPLGLVEVLNENKLPAYTNLLVVVDQFEEIFRFRRLDRTNQADAFVSLLLESAAQREVPIYVVITMRSDYLSDCAVFLGLPEALNRSQYLTPRMNRAQRTAAIVSPSRVFGGDVDPHLLNRLLNDSGADPDHLPVLQHLLMRMWTHVPPGSPYAPCTPGTAAPVAPPLAAPLSAPRLMTMDDYNAEDVGGFAHAISRHAEEAFAQLKEGAQREIAELMFRRMCERGADGRDTRRPIPVSEIAELVEKTVPGASADDVIAVADVYRKPLYGFIFPFCPQPLVPDTVLDITHESLIKRWDRLSEWVDREAESVRKYRYVHEAANRWHSESGALWGTPDLDNALRWQREERPTREWASRYGGDYSVVEKFISESLARRKEESERRAAERRKKLKNARNLAFGFGALALVAVIALFFVYKQSRLSHSRELAAAALANLETNPERSVWLSLHALHSASTPEAHEALQRSVLASRVKLTVAAGARPVRAAAFTSDGKKIVTGHDDGTTRVWDLSSKQLGSFSDHDEESGSRSVAAVASNPKFELFASVGFDGHMVLRNLTDGSRIALPKDEVRYATRSVFSPDGRKVAVCGWDSMVRVYSADTGRRLGPPIDAGIQEGGVLDLAFSPDGARIATAGFDASWAVWNLDGKLLLRRKGLTMETDALVKVIMTAAKQPAVALPHSERITSIVFNDTGSLIATGSSDRTAKVWDSRKGELLLTLTGHAAGITRVSFSPNGARLATASDDMTAKLWDVVSGRPLITLTGHLSPVNDLSFSPDQDGYMLVTASDDGTAKVWNIPPGHTDQVYVLSYSPDGRKLASAGRDWKVFLRDAPAMADRPDVLRRHFAPVTSLAFDPSGNHIVTGGEDKTVIFWDVRTHKPIWERGEEHAGHKDRINTVAISQDGNFIVSGGNDQAVIVWDASGGKTKELKMSGAVQSAAFRPGHEALLAVALNSGTSGKVVFLDSRTWEERDIGIVPQHRDGIYRIAFSPDGRLLVTAGADRQAKIWDLDSRRALHVLPHDGVVADVDFSRDRKLLATGSWDRTARVWDVASGRLVYTVTHPATVNSLQFSLDGKYLATACDDYVVRTLPLDFEELKKLARERLTHELDVGDCQKYLKKTPCPPTPF